MVKNAYSHRLPYSYQICPDITLWASLWRVMMPAAERGFTANSIVAWSWLLWCYQLSFVIVYTKLLKHVVQDTRLMREGQYDTLMYVYSSFLEITSVTLQVLRCCWKQQRSCHVLCRACHDLNCLALPCSVPLIRPSLWTCDIHIRVIWTLDKLHVV